MAKQRGFAFLELLLVVVVLGAVAFTAVNVYNRHQAAVNPPAASTSDTTAATASVPQAPQVTSAPDLDAAEAALDQTNVDAGTSDSSQLSSQTSGF